MKCCCLLKDFISLFGGASENISWNIGTRSGILLMMYDTYIPN